MRKPISVALAIISIGASTTLPARSQSYGDSFYSEPSVIANYGVSHSTGTLCAELAAAEKYALIDRKGNFLTKPIFQYMNAFAEGLCAVKTDEKFGYLDRSGKMIIPARFQFANSFRDGRALVKIDDLYGFIDRNGNYLIHPQFTHASEFSNGRSLVVKNGRFGFIDRSGRMVIPAKYKYAESFSEGLALIYDGNRYGYIDTVGRTVIKPRFTNANSFHEGRAVASEAGEVINRGFIDGTICISGPIQGKYGYIATDGHFICEPNFEAADDFSEGMASVRFEGKDVDTNYGYIGLDGSTKVKPQYQTAFPFTNGRAFVIPLAKKTNGKEEPALGLLIDKKGRTIKRCDGYTIRAKCDADVEVFQNDLLFGYKNKQGKEIIPPRFLNARPFDGGVAIVSVVSVEGLSNSLEAKRAYTNGLLSLMRKQEGKAREFFSEAIGYDPKMGAAYYQRARLWDKEKQEKLILEDLDKTIENGFEACELTALRADYRSDNSKYKEAIDDYTFCLSRQPDFVYWLERRAELLSGLGRHQEAIRDLSKSIAIQENRGDLAKARKAPHVSLSVQEQAPSEDSSAYYTARYTMGSALLQRATEYEFIGDLDSAIKDFSLVLEQSPNDERALNNRKDCYLKTGRFAEAAADLSKLIAKSPENDYLYRQRAEAYQRIGQYDLSIKDCQKFLENAPNCTYTLWLRGKAYQGKGDYKRAYRDFNLSIRRGYEAPDFRKTLFQVEKKLPKNEIAKSLDQK